MSYFKHSSSHVKLPCLHQRTWIGSVVGDRFSRNWIRVSALLLLIGLSCSGLAQGAFSHTAFSHTAFSHTAFSHTALAQSGEFSQQMTPNQRRSTDERAHFLAEDSCVVVLKSQLDVTSVLTEAGVSDGTRVERATALYQALTAHAAANQAALVTLLDEREATYNQFYIVNMIEVVADPALCTELESHPDVDRVEDNPIVQGRLAVDAPMASWAERRVNGWLQVLGFADAAMTQDIPYGLEVSGAIAAHAKGYTGSGITVASQDTGVQWEHPLIKSKYRGWAGDGTTIEHRYNWFDVWGTENRAGCDVTNAQIPCDDNGHGTHTVGTILGGDPANDTLTGVAPDANWIGCRNMLSGLGRPSSYTSCFEFFLAPYPQDGNKLTDGRPDLGPDIINNSWGCPVEEGCDASASLILEQVVDTMRVAGQFVVASAGNSGSSCGSVNQPIAMHDSSFSIGAHDSAGGIARFSSRGPVLTDASGRPKPDISAPGVRVKSAALMTDVTDPVAYSWLSGTSMASPHVAGAAALLWSAAPSLNGDIDRTEEVLIKSANPSTSPMTGCSSGAKAGFDYAHGYGHLDIVEAIDLALGPIDITINFAIADEQKRVATAIVLVDEITGATTSQAPTTGTGTLTANGTALFQNVIAGAYTIRIESATEVIRAVQVQTEPGVNEVVTITDEEKLFFPAFMGG